MLIDRKRIVLDDAETFFTLYSGDAFCVEEGYVDIYVVIHTQEGKEERRVHVCTVHAQDSLAIPAFFSTYQHGEVCCFALDAGKEGAVLKRILCRDEQRKQFVNEVGIQEYEDFERSLLHHYEWCEYEKDNSRAIVIDEENAFFADDPGEAYYVESGAVYVYLTPVSNSGMSERREYLCRATPQDEFCIVGMMYESGDRIWRIHVIPESGKAVLRPITCTRITQEKFIEAIQKQCSIKNAAGKTLLDAYKHEGFQESLVQYYAWKNELADIIRENRQEKQKADIRREIDNAIKDGISGEAYEDAGLKEVRELYRILKYLSDKSGISLLEEYELAKYCPKMTLTEIARVCGFICREVTLDKGWFHCDCGPLLCMLEDRPVACISHGDAGYGIYDLAAGREIRLTSHTAERIHPRAYSIQRGLPARSISYRDILHYAIKGICRKDIVWFVLLGALSLFVSILLPYLNQKIYDDYIPMSDMNMLVQLCLLTGTFMMGNIVFALVKKLYEFRIVSRIRYDLQNAIFARMFELPEKFLHQFESGDLAKRVQSFGALSNAVVTMIIVAGISVVFALVYLFQMIHYGKKLVPCAVLMILLFAFAAYLISIFALKYEKTKAEKDNESHGKLQQFLSGIEKIRMAGMEEHAILEYIKPIAQYQQASIRANRIKSFCNVLRDASGTVFSMAMYFLMVRDNLELSIGNFIGFNTAFGLFASAVMGATDDLIRFHFLKPKLEQIKPLMEAAPETDKCKKLNYIEKLDGRIDFEHVTFSYDEEKEPVLRNLSFTIHPGEYVGLVGKSGCGKSTILKLLLGFECSNRGRILYDGQDISSIDKHSLRRRLGVVLQNGSLIAGSIYDNIVITSENPSRMTAEAAVEKAGLKADIEAMPMHLDTMINESAGTISGGQKQRILIARAIAGNPDVLLFDEATSALDNAAQAQICENLDKMNITRIVIAHRLSTIKHCDRILVLDKGKIVEEGNYRELFEKRGLFYDMAVRQIAGIEEDKDL